MKPEKTNLVWIDLEMTGLNAQKDVIIEIATIITDNNLNVIAAGPELVIHQPDSVLESMNAEVTKMHAASGLTERVRNSTVTLEQAKQETLDFIKQYCQEGQSPLCGNSVWQDKIFLQKYMSEITDYLHYRIIDVTSIKQCLRYWTGNPDYPKNKTHRALDDIKESIDELRFYKKNYFNLPG